MSQHKTSRSFALESSSIARCVPHSSPIMIAARAAANRLAVAVTSCDREHPSRALLRDGDHLIRNLRVDDDPSPVVRTITVRPLWGGNFLVQVEDPHLLGLWTALKTQHGFDLKTDTRIIYKGRQLPKEKDALTFFQESGGVDGMLVHTVDRLRGGMWGAEVPCVVTLTLSTTMPSVREM